jgi:hypothetical protein
MRCSNPGAFQPQDRRILQAAIPRTEQVAPEQADALWARRRQLFFKPVAGYGAKAAYRGDKLTHRVWSDIIAGDFVAQDLVPPSERLVDVDGQPTAAQTGLARLHLPGPDPVAGRAHLDRPDHQLPHARRRVFARGRVAEDRYCRNRDSPPASFNPDHVPLPTP